MLWFMSLDWCMYYSSALDEKMDLHKFAPCKYVTNTEE